MQHFLLTNFNVRMWYVRRRDRAGRRVRTEEWLAHRWPLFETFCLPSVRNQTSQDFRWLVRFDPATPPHHRERFLALTRDYDPVVPLWRGEPFGVAIRARLRADTR